MVMATVARKKKNSPAEKQARREKELAELKTTFDNRVLELRSTQGWEDMLTTMSVFHRYSLKNMLLIHAQNPEATYCAGYKTWASLGYQVRKGEKGLRILAPVPFTRRDENGEPLTDEEGNELKGMGFRVVSTFDRSQVDALEGAKKIGAENIVRTLEGETGSEYLQKLIDNMSARGWETRIEHIAGGANGYTSHAEKLIVVEATNSPAQQVKTMIHECAHALLHEEAAEGDYQAHRGIYETEAESVAFVVASALGFDTANYSVGYVASWSGAKAEVLEKAAENVLKGARMILEMLEEN